MKIRRFDFEKDYKDVSSWWKSQGWPVLSRDMLSDDGFIAYDDNKKYAATWVYKTNSPIYIMEWLVGNPDVDYSLRKQGIVLVVEMSSLFAKESGAKSLLTMTSNERFAEKLEELKFNETDRNMIHYIRSL